MKNVVTIGGGTGTFVVLSALRLLSDLSLCAIISSADDGGSTGRLRDAYGFLPKGDARQALVALAEDGEILRELFAYRFAKGDVKGHSLGNLFLTALTDILGSDGAALAEASRILRVSGRVVSASEAPTVLIATLSDGTQLRGEHRLDEKIPRRARVSSLSLETPTSAAPAALEAVREAELVILGPGDLYASSIAPLLPSGMREAIAQSAAMFLYIGNLFTKAGQTGGMTAKEHVAELERYLGRPVDRILVHEGSFEPDVLLRYREEGEEPVTDDFADDPRVVRASIASVHLVPPVPEDPVPRSLARHDPALLARALAPLLA